jgi:hypothetical protein
MLLITTIKISSPNKKRHVIQNTEAMLENIPTIITEEENRLLTQPIEEEEV